MTVAEFCLACWNKLNDTHYTEAEMVIDHKELDLCEGCGQYKPVIIRERGPVGRLLWRVIHRSEKKI